MAAIIGGIGVSHSPQIGYAKDTQRPDAADWSEVFDLFVPVTNWLDAAQPDVIVHVYNDHVTSFFFDHYSPFALGVDDRYETADEGGGPRRYPALAGHRELACHIGSAMFAEEFDLSFFQKRPIDHGMFSPLSMMTDHGRRWSGAIVPLQVGVLQFPMPTARRCFQFGRALGRAIESFDDDLDVAVVASGGLSHQVHGERAGFNNTEWDEKFLDLVEADPEALTELTHADYAERGGMEGTEVIMWLIMRGALLGSIRRLHRATHLPSMTNLATLVLEHHHDPDPAELADHRRLVGAQLAGIERIGGTYPFTLERAHASFRLNDFLHGLVRPKARERFVADPSSAYDEYHLTDDERRLIDDRDWIGLIRAGAIFFGLEKLASVLGLSNPEIYAQMRAETLEEFQSSRNVALRYSVAADGRIETDG